MKPSTLDSRPSTDPDVLVRVEGVSKKFCRSLKKSLWYGVCDIAAELNPFRNRRATSDERQGQPPTLDPSLSASATALDPRPSTLDGSLRPGEFFAVRDVSFELKRGECLGLIGHNGAGKTTLLKMLNGLIKPDSGRIEMRGRIGALIALGAGFNPILTGRENIYVNASVLGLSKKEIDEKIQDIIDFSEIGEFIDSPVQSYSSGMAVRLGFSIASSLKPDILILDEVLAVGDIGFVIKCLNRVRQLTNDSAVIFVSHTMQFVSSFCTRVMVMDHGGCILDASKPAEAIDRYFEMIKLESSQSGTGEAAIRSIRMKCGDVLLEKDEPRIQQGQSASLILDLEIGNTSRGAQLHVYVMDESMSPIICIPVIESDGQIHAIPSGSTTITIPLGPLELCSGKYNFTVAIMDSERGTTLNRSQGLHPFRVFASETNWGRIVRPFVVPA